MSDKIPFDFDEYIRQSEPSKQKKGYIWQTAIGLQDVDGLKPSEYLIETAKKNIDGDITLEEANDLIHGYYTTMRAKPRGVMLKTAQRKQTRFPRVSLSSFLRMRLFSRRIS